MRFSVCFLLVIAIGIAGGWVAYRTSQGKPLAPDSAMESRIEYEKMQLELQQRNEQYQKRRAHHHQQLHDHIRRQQQQHQERGGQQQ